MSQTQEGPKVAHARSNRDAGVSAAPLQLGGERGGEGVPELSAVSEACTDDKRKSHHLLFFVEECIICI